jgi:tetratricopeptide (TPR) repeat protein
MRAILSLALLAGAMIASAQAPLCLVGQPISTNGSGIMDLMNPLANEVDSVGQLRCLTYAIEDPAVRDASYAGKIKKPERIYVLEDVLEAAKGLNAPYVLWIEGQNTTYQVGNKTGRGLNCHLTLYKNGKKVWDDVDKQSVSISNEKTTEDTLNAVISSLSSKLQLGPLRGFQKYPKGGEIVPGKGQSPIIPESNDDDPTLNDWNAIQTLVKSYVTNNKLIAAEMLLRDAVDAVPSDPVRRKALIEFLQSNNQVDAAIAVTIASADALGDPTMITSAARILLNANRITEASAMIKDAIATDPSNPAIQIIQAELQMRTSMPDQALKHLENAIKTKQTSEAYFLRAICRGLLGSEEGVKLDLDRAKKDDPKVLSNQYDRMVSILDSAWDSEGPDLRALFQKAILKRSSDEVADGVDSQDRMAKACLNLLGENAANSKFEKSHGMRLLALNLLVQTITELRHYIAKGDQESLDEARIDFGEMLKTLTDAKVQFSKESTDARISNLNTQL